MSSFITMRTSDFVAILSDGATYHSHDDFTVTGMVSKTLVLPHLGCAMVARGSIKLFRLLHFQHAETWSSFDDLVKNLPDQVVMECERYAASFPDSHSAAEFALCGWSELRERFETYHCIMDTEETSDWPVMQPLPAVYMAPEPDRTQIEAQGLIVDGEIRITSLDDLALLMEAQRLTPHETGLVGATEATGTGYICGVFMEQVVVRRDAIVSRIVKRWPDRIGKLIDPFAQGQAAS